MTDNKTDSMPDDVFSAPAPSPSQQQPQAVVSVSEPVAPSGDTSSGGGAGSTVPPVLASEQSKSSSSGDSKYDMSVAPASPKSSVPQVSVSSAPGTPLGSGSGSGGAKGKIKPAVPSLFDSKLSSSLIARPAPSSSQVQVGSESGISAQIDRV